MCETIGKKKGEQVRDIFYSDHKELLRDKNCKKIIAFQQVKVKVHRSSKNLKRLACRQVEGMVKLDSDNNSEPGE